MIRRLNLGCGALPLDGYVNVDAYDEHADIQKNVFELDIPVGSVEEIRMDHMLEHLAIAEGPKALWHCCRWLARGGKLVVEVPDMEELMANPGPNWPTDIYGVQSHEGEFHKSGYTKTTLIDLIYQVGLKPESVQTFRSSHPYRQGFPCLQVVAVK